MSEQAGRQEAAAFFFLVGTTLSTIGVSLMLSPFAGTTFLGIVFLLVAFYPW